MPLTRAEEAALRARVHTYQRHARKDFDRLLATLDAARAFNAEQVAAEIRSQAEAARDAIGEPSRG